VRCASCLTLNGVGEERCIQCGAALELEAEPTPTELICPRGCGALARVSDVSECQRCGGIFVGNEMLAALVTKHRPVDGERRASITPPTPAPDTVVYIPCPTCNVRMNRTVFGRSSGVIVDVCKAHGTWFDARELTASLAFVERGGLELVAKREAQRKADEARAKEVERRTKGLERLSEPVVGGLGHLFVPDSTGSAESVRTLLDILLSL
jgi:Zn-finger nucleic acid-binding protein